MLALAAPSSLRRALQLISGVRRATDTLEVSEVARSPRTTYVVTTVTARRTLEFVPDGGKAKPVVVRIGRPRRAHVNGDWVCPFDISGMAAPCKRWAFGIDGIQALSLAFHIIPEELRRLATLSGGGHFRFLGEEGISFADGCGMLLNQALDQTFARKREPSRAFREKKRSMHDE